MEPEKPAEEMKSVFLGFPLWGPLRAVLRMVVLLGWVIGCYAALKLVSLVLLPWPAARKRAGIRINLAWCKGMRYLVGMRVVRYGQLPPEPYFHVCNHITWGDYFLMMVATKNMSYILQAEDEHLPFAGPLMAAGDPIFNVRKRDGVQRTLQQMVAFIQRGERNLGITPEGVVGPGREVRRFHAALLEAAVRTQKPVYYNSITCRTPEGYPPAFQVVLYGPDPLFVGADGKVPQSEIDDWGQPPQPFLPHLWRLLQLPWHEFTVRFAPEPIVPGEDRVALANQLREAVQGIFTPVAR